MLMMLAKALPKPSIARGVATKTKHEFLVPQNTDRGPSLTPSEVGSVGPNYGPLAVLRGC